MAYFGGSLSARGDPGFFDTLFGGVKKIGGAIFRSTPVGAVVSEFIPPRGAASIPQIAPPPLRRTLPVTRGFEAPRGTGTAVPARIDPRTGMLMRRRRRMNVGNTKALRRAIRRTDGFVSLAKSALKNTGWKVVSKSSGKMTEAAFRKRAHHAT